MDFELSKPQQLLQSTVRDFLARECPPARVRELMETATAVDDELWEGIADQGWTGLTLPEEHEGLGLGAVDLAAVAEVMGEVCLPGPFISNHWASPPVAGATPPAERARPKSVTRTRPSGPTMALSGLKSR